MKLSWVCSSAAEAMATGSLVEMLLGEVLCSLCNKYFTEPVSIDCGHSFCQVCIKKSWERWGGDYSCPRCGEISLKRKLTPNRDLANVVEVAKQIKSEIAGNVTKEEKCEIHQEPLKLFCKDEQKLRCAVCQESKDQSSGAFIPVEDAIQDYKEKLDGYLQIWREKREKASSFHAVEECRCKGFLEKVDAKKQKIVSKFEEMENFLKEQKRTMLDQLEELVKKEEGWISKLAGEVYLCDSLIKEMEEKVQKPPAVFLQDIKTTLNRCKAWDFQQPDICSELENELHAIFKNYIVLQDTFRVFTENLSQRLEMKLASVTLDPDTAHPQLTVSTDQKILTWTKVPRSVKDYPQRFTSSFCVLGCEGFSSGKHYWEVEVGDEGFWAVGVARESVKRKETFLLPKLEAGIWAVSKEENGRFTARGHELNNGEIPTKIGICLDYDGNEVSFLDADDDEGNVLHIFQSAFFKGEKIRPFFFLASSIYFTFQGLKHPIFGSANSNFSPFPTSYVPDEPEMNIRLAII